MPMGLIAANPPGSKAAGLPHSYPEGISALSRWLRSVSEATTGRPRAETAFDHGSGRSAPLPARFAIKNLGQPGAQLRAILTQLP